MHGCDYSQAERNHWSKRHSSSLTIQLTTPLLHLLNTLSINPSLVHQYWRSWSVLVLAGVFLICWKTHPFSFWNFYVKTICLCLTGMDLKHKHSSLKEKYIPGRLQLKVKLTYAGIFTCLIKSEHSVCYPDLFFKNNIKFKIHLPPGAKMNPLAIHSLVCGLYML